GRLNNGQTAYSTTLVGTNSCYPFVLNYPVLAGGFWSQSAWKGKERQLVLNEKAAFHILGGNDIIGLTLQLDGEIWLVSGVIRDDYEDEVRAYLPSSQSGGSPKSLLALSKSTLAYAASALKDLGVQESAYDIVSLEAAAHQYRQWWLVALFLFHCLIFSLLIRWGIVWLKVQLGFAREQLRHLYPKEFLRSNRKLALKSAACLLLSLVGVVVILILLIRTMAMVLSWQDLPPLAGILTEGAWLNKIAPLVDYRLLGLGLFWGFMAALLVYAIVSWRRKKAIRNS
ncbi:MAG: ABC transporter permease, partial [Clostridiales bacterium]|nr:ABC transporter permease [Clostridiales bacterium]